MSDQKLETPPSYDEVRASRKAGRKASKAAKKAAKPKGIDFPIWKAMPMPLLVTFLVLTVAALGTIVVVMIKPPTPTIAVAARRSPPSQNLSHYVGPILLAPVPDTLPPTKVACPAIQGIVIEGGPPAQARLGGVLERICPQVTGDSNFSRSIRALSKAHLRFAQFARTGDVSTLSLQDPVRILINVRFARHDQSAMYIAPMLAHEGFHLLHADERFSATLELEAREVELTACRLLIDVDAWPRGCTDAKQLVGFGRARAIRALVQAGFPA